MNDEHHIWTVNLQFPWQLKHQTQIIFFEHKWFINWFIPLEAFVVSKSLMNSHKACVTVTRSGIFLLRLLKILQHPKRFAWKNYISIGYFIAYFSLLEFYVNEIKIKNKKAEKIHTHKFAKWKNMWKNNVKIILENVSNWAAE